MLDLDSPRWTTLRHAYGQATDIPAKVRVLACTPPPKDETTWRELRASLLHQGDIYPATFAIVPHLVRLAEDGGVRRQADVLCFVRDTVIHPFARRVVPADVLGDFESAVEALRPLALGVVRKAPRELPRYYLPEVIAACIAMNAGRIPGIASIPNLFNGDLYGRCPSCRRDVHFQISGDDILEDEGGGHLTPQKILEPSTLRSLLPDAARLLAGEPSAGWEALALPAAAALAEEVCAPTFASAIIQLDTVIACARCSAAVRVVDHNP